MSFPQKEHCQPTTHRFYQKFTNSFSHQVNGRNGEDDLEVLVNDKNELQKDNEVLRRALKVRCGEAGAGWRSRW